jgi:Fur family ferric uptake transcriptional regulator
MKANLSYTDLLDLIEDNGSRITGQRRDIVNLLVARREGFTPEEINNELPNVGRATVYRTIKLLVNSGVLCKLTLPDSSIKYALAQISHHHHTVCVKCGIIGEFRDSTVERLLKAIDSDIDGDIVGHRLELHILCPECTRTRE